MFGLSLGKILLTLLLVVVAWRAVTWVSQLAREANRNRVGTRGRPPGRSQRADSIELIQCRHCGAYFDPHEGCRCQQRR